LAQTRRLLLAKQLLTDTSLRVVDVAFASGFQSVRHFNRMFKQSYRLNPLQLRKQRTTTSDTGIVLKLGFRPPLAWQPLVRFLAGRSGINTECTIDNKYMRTIRIGKQSGWIAAEPERPNLLRVEVSASLLPVLPELQARLRRLFDLDANPSAIESHLASHATLRARLKHAPGLRVPGAICGYELALRAVLGQQITVKAATTIFGRFVDTFGASIATPFDNINRIAPRAEDVANASLQQLIDRGLTRKRAETVSVLSRAAADGALRLEPPAEFDATRESLQEIPGIGPWTAEYVAMRALRDPDAFPHSDLGLLHALKIEKPAKLQALAEKWRPWRAYAALHLWHGLGSGG
jgi:AraC family transcriptional regulator of adaptative response / DNA-3-methyladenine glycosylase II